MTHLEDPEALRCCCLVKDCVYKEQRNELVKGDERGRCKVKRKETNQMVAEETMQENNRVLSC
jgi:hypothetical protein